MTEVATNRARFNNDELREVQTATQAVEQLLGGQIVDLSEEFGSGFEVLEDKSRLINESFLILEWHFTNGENGEFVSATVMTTADSRKLIVNDGSTGIRDQLHQLEARGVFRGVFVRKGLRVSEFYYNPEDLNEAKSREAKPGWKKGTTYYLAV